MSKERYNQIIDAAYGNYIYNPDYKAETVADLMGSQAGQLFKCPTQEDFINQCKTDSEFSEKWGLKIEERELSLEESAKWLQDNKGYDLLVGSLDHDHIREVVEEESPTKLITLTYNNEKIESYE